MHNQIHVEPSGLRNVLVRTEITELVHPYLRYVEGWQLRSSYLRAQLSRHRPGSVQHDLADRRLSELRAEIEIHRELLVGAASRLPPDDRIDATLDELDALLSSLHQPVIVG